MFNGLVIKAREKSYLKYTQFVKLLHIFTAFALYSKAWESNTKIIRRTGVLNPFIVSGPVQNTLVKLWNVELLVLFSQKMLHPFQGPAISCREHMQKEDFKGRNTMKDE